MTLSLGMVSARLPSDSIFIAQGQMNKVYIPLKSSENVDKHQKHRRYSYFLSALNTMSSSPPVFASACACFIRTQITPTLRV